MFVPCAEIISTAIDKRIGIAVAIVKQKFTVISIPIPIMLFKLP